MHQELLQLDMLAHGEVHHALLLTDIGLIWRAMISEGNRQLWIS